ncbi:Sublancin-168-processing and transport ATP-binding protein sunT [Seminavis robusta]|uniref:Sublancin-168-processing and transport ATP-binding protein sunT n=1 Tax=Seminavis robusta TaxID=568900 RepID=A0A9N8H5Y7_9STRA|nr:Sublancin-168-processing and transport ATP-binding protein sunT [Seminavis robusta]|eukprot:Sro85_g045360.1 Sublancin-168-processing and transport ATP-binding protein sunT (791) ;mRNA; f:62887-65259
MTKDNRESSSSTVSSSSSQPPSRHQEDAILSKRLGQVVYLLCLIKGFVFPFFKVSLIALAEKVLRAAIGSALPDELFGQIQTEIFDKSSNPVMDTFLMRSLTFYEAFAVVGGITAVISIVLPLGKALTENFLPYREVKRLQDLLFRKFVLEPNSVAIDEATNLLYTKINVVSKYWFNSKFQKIDDIVTMGACLVLYFILAWDLALALLGGMILVFVVSFLIWNKLSTPWDSQREEKMTQANNLLVDVVLCKELVLTQANELEEQAKLRKLMEADREDIRHLVWAKFISAAIRVGTFTMITPSLFFVVFMWDLSMERVFQLLLIIVVTDEQMRAFLSFTNHGPMEQEYGRAKQEFCHVLGMTEEELFPGDFDDWTICGGGKKKNSFEADESESKDDTRGELDLEVGGYDSFRVERASTIGKKQVSRRDLLRQAMEDMSSELSDHLNHPKNGVDKLSLDAASFGYKDKEGNTFAIVQNLTTTLNIGAHYAVMGETGVGKSTFLKALSGLHEPLSGEIYFDSKAVDPTSIEWRRQVAVVTQHAVFLSRSLRENMIYGLEDKVTDEQIYDALDKVKMKERIMTLPKGLDTIIVGNGSHFSGGQRQRLQIARLLLTNAPLVLLDECTSALDPDTTTLVMDLLQEFLVGKTMIMITHDVSNLILAQHVMEMKPGGVFEKAKNQRVADIYSDLDGRRPSEILQEFQRGGINWLSESMRSLDANSAHSNNSATAETPPTPLRSLRSNKGSGKDFLKSYSAHSAHSRTFDGDAIIEEEEGDLSSGDLFDDEDDEEAELA